jgi:hypothetical protein
MPPSLGPLFVLSFFAGNGTPRRLGDCVLAMRLHELPRQGVNGVR